MLNSFRDFLVLFILLQLILLKPNEFFSRAKFIDHSLRTSFDTTTLEMQVVVRLFLDMLEETCQGILRMYQGMDQVTDGSVQVGIQQGVRI